MLDQAEVIRVLRYQASSLRKQAEQLPNLSQGTSEGLHKVATKLDSIHVKNFLNFYGRMAN